MTRTRTEFDADHQHSHLPKAFETSENRYAVPCSICGKTYYFDQNGKSDLERSLTDAGDNTFVCIECEGDYNELAYGN